MAQHGRPYLFNTVNIEAFQKTLEAFARELGAGTDMTIILVLDNAGWHTTEKIKPAEGLILLFLPPYTPELQPAERLWPLVNNIMILIAEPRSYVGKSWVHLGNAG